MLFRSGDDEIELSLPEYRAGRGKAVCRQNAKPCAGEQQTQRVCHAKVVIDDEDSFALTLVHEFIHEALQVALQLSYTVANSALKRRDKLRSREKSGNLLSGCAVFRRSRRADRRSSVATGLARSLLLHGPTVTSTRRQS